MRSCAASPTAMAVCGTASVTGLVFYSTRLVLWSLVAGMGLGRVLSAVEEGPSRARKMQELAQELSQEDKEGGPVGVPSVKAWGGRSFPVQRSDTALVLIDLQTDFLSPEGRLAGTYTPEQLAPMQETLKKAARLLAAARKAGLTIAHSRSHRYGASVRRDLLSPLDEGYELCPEVRALPGEVVVDKWTFGAFASTDLEAELRARGVKRILLAGVLTNVCVFATAVQAVDRFFRVCLVEDACNAFNREWHRRAVSLIHEPQAKKGHAGGAVGLYFGEVASLVAVEEALEELKP
mmetsp:Transcript_119569/g.266929  ORF Transcript_119569/g.266929 Transcript_119569/m.266929 type:complete len:293 (-) Transcript_119569:145-1023(-)